MNSGEYVLDTCCGCSALNLGLPSPTYVRVLRATKNSCVGIQGHQRLVNEHRRQQASSHDMDQTQQERMCFVGFFRRLRRFHLWFVLVALLYSIDVSVASKRERHIAHHSRHRSTMVAASASRVNPANLNRINNNMVAVDDFSTFRLGESQVQHEVAPSINDTLTPANITGQLGSTVYLHCVVHNRAQKTVTWLRRSDYHILTVGLLTYTSDERFSSSTRVLQSRDALTFPLTSSSNSIVTAATTDNSAWSLADRITGPDRTEDWMLQIRRAAETDAGEYECQINTQHPLVSTSVNLVILAPYAQIVESPELYVNSGSTIALTCVIHDCPQPLTHIFWYHQDRVINYERHVNVTMERPGLISEEVRTSKLGSDILLAGSGSGDRHNWMWTQISRLLIHIASTEHSGRYTCAPVDSTPASVHVHVLQAEEHLGSRRSHDASSAGSAGGGRVIEAGSILDRPWMTLSFLGGIPLLAFELLFLIVVAKTT